MGAAADEQGDARAVVDALHNQLFAVASDTALSFDERLAQLAPVVETSFDFNYIGRFILRRSWRDLQEAEQQKFVGAFKRLSVANYASRFEKIEQQSLLITDVGPASGERVQVDSRLQTQDLDLTLSYTLQAGADNNWSIINVIADGVSDLALRRAEYSRVIKDKGFDGLMLHIDEQIADLN